MTPKKLQDKEALLFHSEGKPGKYEITPTKPLSSQKDLSLAYSPGVAAPCRAIEKDPSDAYKYTNKGNMVAVISNGTAVLGLGNIGALASKPVMEGKSVLFKWFSGIDSIDLEVDTQNIEEFINAVKYLGPSFGGINLEDIKAPDCFEIEERLKKEMDIPVFHDDQHGTAIAVLAGLMNSIHIAKKNLSDIRIVCLGAGAAAIACANLLVKYGINKSNLIMLDRAGVIYKGRKNSMNSYKAAYANDTACRTLEEAIDGADVFIGLSTANVLTEKMVKSMAPNPVIFAMANPDPEIKPEVALKVRPDVLIATGRSDYPNQVNNALCFPYIFRGALDVRASEINDEMKIAAAEGLAQLARAEVSEEANKAYNGRPLDYGRNYIIPVPFDPRLIQVIPPLVAEAAMRTGVARMPISDMAAYRRELVSRFDATYSNLEIVAEKVRQNPKRVVFAEGEEPRAIRAALSFYNQGLGTPILIGKEKRIQANAKKIGIKLPAEIILHNAKLCDQNEVYSDYIFERLKRKGRLKRDCQRYINQNRNVFGACMVAFGHADAVVTGLTRNYAAALRDIKLVYDPSNNTPTYGYSIVIVNNRPLVIADTAIHQNPNPQQLADIAIHAACITQTLGQEPRVAFLSHGNFGNPITNEPSTIQQALQILDQEPRSFEYEGEMTPSVALDPEMRTYYPFNRLSGPANVLIMPDLNSACITTQMICEKGQGSMIGPILTGFNHPAQIVSMTSSTSDLLKSATFAAYQAVQHKNESCN